MPKNVDLLTSVAETFDQNQPKSVNFEFYCVAFAKMGRNGNILDIYDARPVTKNVPSEELCSNLPFTPFEGIVNSASLTHSTTEIGLGGDIADSATAASAAAVFEGSSLLF